MIDHHKLIQIKQKFSSSTVENITERIKSEIASIKLEVLIKPGDSVAITAGSRGISDINLITRNVINEAIKKVKTSVDSSQQDTLKKAMEKIARQVQSEDAARKTRKGYGTEYSGQGGAGSCREYTLGK